jgi:hypothetical protein
VTTTIGSTINVYIGAPNHRRLVTATLLSINSRTIYVRLPDGNVVQRRVDRDVPGWERGTPWQPIARPVEG